MLRIYQSQFQSETCYANITNTSNVDDFLPNDNQEQCYSYPTLRILLSGILFFEVLKLLMGFFRIAKKTRKKIIQVDDRTVEKATIKTSNLFLDENESSVVKSNVAIKTLSVAHLNNDVEVSSINKNLDVSDCLNLPKKESNLSKFEDDKFNKSDEKKGSNDQTFEDSIATRYESAKVEHEDNIDSNQVETKQNLQTLKINIAPVFDLNETYNDAVNDTIVPSINIRKTEKDTDDSEKIFTVSNECVNSFEEIEREPNQIKSKLESNQNMNLNNKDEPKKETTEENENHEQVKTSVENKDEILLPKKESVKTTPSEKPSNSNKIYLKSLKDTFQTLVAKKSLWSLISSLALFLLIFSTSTGLAEVILVLLRLEVYFVPVFWTLTDDKVLLFFITRFKRCFRIYQFRS